MACRCPHAPCAAPSQIGGDYPQSPFPGPCRPRTGLLVWGVPEWLESIAATKPRGAPPGTADQSARAGGVGSRAGVVDRTPEVAALDCPTVGKCPARPAVTRFVLLDGGDRR